MRGLVRQILLVLIAVVGAVSFGRLALSRGETISAAWLLTAAICTYVVAYRLYSRFIASRIFELNDERATPAVRARWGARAARAAWAPAAPASAPPVSRAGATS